MLDVSTNFLDALTGSFTPVHKVDAWYDGDLVASDLPITSATIVADSSRVIDGSVSLVIQTNDETLRPDSYDSPLAPYGSELHISAGLLIAGSPELLSCGWFRIDDCDPDEWWAKYQLPDGSIAWAMRGLQLTVNGSDRMAYLDDDQMLAPEQPASLLSTTAEITRLARDDAPVTDLADAVDRVIPTALTYEQSRVTNVRNLAALLGQTARMNRDGALALYPKTPGPSVWTVAVGDNAVSWSNKLTRDGINNAVVSQGDGAQPLQGIAQETAGPLRYDGPFGRVPLLHSSPLLTTQDAADADAAAELDRSISQRVMPVTVECAANPAIELDDVVTVVQPKRTLTGQVASISLPLPLSTMTLTLLVPRADLWGS